MQQSVSQWFVGEFQTVWPRCSGALHSLDSRVPAGGAGGAGGVRVLTLGSMTDAEAERTPLLGVADIPPGGRTVATRWVERRPERPTGTARLLRRAGGVLGQSPGKWDIEHKWGEKSSCCAWMDRVETVWDAGRRLLYRSDPFHTVVRAQLERTRRASRFSAVAEGTHALVADRRGR